MKFHELNAPASKKATRVGRGIAAGKGKTAGRGTKGQNARKSGGTRPGFEGGQNPMWRKTPKLPGFRSMRIPATNIYTGQLDALAPTVDNYSLFDAGLTTSPYVRVKLVVKGEVTKKVAVSLQGASEGAKTALQKAGGSFKQIDQIKRDVTSKTSRKAQK